MKSKIVKRIHLKSDTIILLAKKNRKLQIQIDKLQNKILKLENKTLKLEQKVLKAEKRPYTIPKITKEMKNSLKKHGLISS